jgi:hypothetical protein
MPRVCYRTASACAALLLSVQFVEAAAPQVPTVDGPWWQIAGNPMDHEHATAKQEPVDFAVWQAADGSWQLWSCLRGTTAGGKSGKSRLFYRWEGKKMTDSHWQPMGIAMQADPSLGETPGGLQAPHVVRVGDVYHMFYGDWVNICHAISSDGKSFTRVVQPNGQTGMFSEGPEANARDIMLLRHDDRWYGYYTCHPNRQGMVCLRTTDAFRSSPVATDDANGVAAKYWSEPTVVAFGGQPGTAYWSAESPHVVKRGEKQFYLFRTQSYGAPKEGDIRNRGPAKTYVYFSTDPAMFGINQDDRYLLGTLNVAAPEVVLHEGDYYIAALNEGALDGIRVAPLKWSSP